MIYFQDEENDNKEEAEVDDEDATLDDSVLDEVESGDESEEETDVEGFGHVNESDSDEEDEEEDDETNELEEDAEDVDYDTFDDVDEM